MVVLDPYATTVLGRRRYGELGPELAWKTPGVLGYASTWPQAACALPSPFEDEEFDWEGDRPLNIPMEEIVIYEMHVRGFTQDPSSGVSAPGESSRVHTQAGKDRSEGQGRPSSSYGAAGIEVSVELLCDLRLMRPAAQRYLTQPR